MIFDIVLEEGAYKPSLAHGHDVGYDLRARESGIVPPGGSRIFDTGVRVRIDEEYAGFVKSRSGLMVNHEITTDGVIDPNYTGTIRVKLFNHGGGIYHVKEGDKIAQLCFVRIGRPTLRVVEQLEKTERGDGGFGSTGR